MASDGAGRDATFTLLIQELFDGPFCLIKLRRFRESVTHEGPVRGAQSFYSRHLMPSCQDRQNTSESHPTFEQYNNRLGNPLVGAAAPAAPVDVRVLPSLFLESSAMDQWFI